MKTKTVYVLKNTDTQEVEYVGCSQNIKRRLFQHTRVKPGYSKGEGKFYGRTNLVLEPIKEFTDKNEAYHYEGKMKKKYGFEWTEMTHWKIAQKKGQEAIQKPVAVYDYKTKKFVGNFKSQAECSRVLGLTPICVSWVMNKKRNHTGGYSIVSI